MTPSTSPQDKLISPRFTLLIVWLLIVLITPCLLNRYMISSSRYTPTPTFTPNATAQMSCATMIAAMPASVGGWIAYSSWDGGSGTAAMIMNPDGSNKVQVTSNGRINTVDDWSPDGQELLIQSGGSWDSQFIYRLDLQTCREQAVTFNGGESGADWSPNGYEILFLSIENHLQIADVNGYIFRTVVSFRNNTEPEWSPDAKQILFTSYYGGGNIKIFVIDSSGANLKMLANVGSSYDPTWSPDGKRIAFSSNRQFKYVPTNTPNAQGTIFPGITGTPFVGEYQIYVMDADGSNVTQVTTSFDNFHPTWSPDGTQIAFESLKDGRHDIFVINVDGSNLRQLTNTGTNSKPVWSP